MSHKKITLPYMRYMGANATLSTVSTTVPFVVTPVVPDVLPIDTNHSFQQVKPNMKKDKKNIEPSANKIEPNKTKNDDQSKQPKSSSNKTPISKLSVVAIALTICLGGFVYFHGHQQIAAQKQNITKLETEISTLKQTLQQSITDDIKSHVAEAVDSQNKQLTALDQNVKNGLNEQTQRQQAFIAKVEDSIKVTEQNLYNFNERLAAVSTTDNNIWLISQANYLVNLAGRKIWNDQDYTTARLLLKNADSSLAQANDPSLLPARQAINKDIAALAAISFTDFDGIIMTLMNLADSVVELPLVDNYQDIDLGMTQHDDSILEPTKDLSDESKNTQAQSSESQTSKPQVEATNNEVSSSIFDWSDNLAKSSQSFLQKFIQVEKYDTFGECIAGAGKDPALLEKCQVHTAVIMPEQALYLRENIRLQLFIAAQSVPRHQELIYQRALNDVSTWANAYFDNRASSVKAFLNELDNLKQQSITNENVPEKLSSKDELDKLMQTRVRAMLTN